MTGAPLRVALVGLGHAGFDIHLPALAAMPDVRLVGACDPDAASRDRAAEKFHVATFAEFDRMAGETRPDVVIIGTPPETHAAYCLSALAAGAHVISEKPFVSSLAEADQVLSAAAAAGRQIAVNHQFREMPIFQALLAETKTSDVAFAQVWQLMDVPPGSESGWRGALRHRALFEAGVHLIDFVMALFGETPVSVQATQSACGLDKGVADAAVLVTLEFSRGRLAHITQNRVCKGARQYFEVRAETATASLRASFGGRSRITAGLYRSTKPHVRFEHGLSGLAWKERGLSRDVLARNPGNPMVAATKVMFTKTLDAFRNGGQPPTSGALARDIIRVIAACYRSAETGRRLRMDAPEMDQLADLKMAGA